MTSATHRRIHDRVHYGWSRDHPPALSIPAGAEISFDVLDASGGQLRPGTVGHKVVR